MLEALRPKVAAIVELRASAAARTQGTAGMRFDPMEEAAARELPGPAVCRQEAVICFSR